MDESLECGLESSQQKCWACLPQFFISIFIVCNHLNHNFLDMENKVKKWVTICLCKKHIHVQIYYRFFFGFCYYLKVANSLRLLEALLKFNYSLWGVKMRSWKK